MAIERGVFVNVSFPRQFFWLVYFFCVCFPELVQLFISSVGKVCENPQSSVGKVLRMAESSVGKMYFLT